MLHGTRSGRVWSPMSMQSTTTFRSDESFTVRTFRRWVDSRPMSDVNHYELVRGRIVMTPPAGWTHASLGALIVGLLEVHVRRHRLGKVFDASLGYILPSGDVLEPDASFVSTRRFEANRPSRPNEYLRAVPNLVVEILSPGTAVRDRGEKKDLYEQGGVDEYWIVDSDHRAVTVFMAGPRGYGAGRTAIGGALRSRVLPKLRVSVAKLFQD